LLTAEELRELSREFREALDRFKERRLRENRPAGSRQVRVSVVLAPLGPPPRANS
jgi:hypothetical protein